MSTPMSNIFVCSGVRLNSRYDHSIYFEDQQAQAEYFTGKVVKTFPSYTYLRKTWPLKVEATMEQAKKWNYLFFQNNGSGKIYYYFINQVEYINDNTVQLSLELDVIQTYLFDFEVLHCFVERQHTVSDTWGEHTVDEGLEVGEMVVGKSTDIGNGELCILVLSSITLNGTSEETTIPNLSYVYGNVFSGLCISAVALEDWAEWAIQLENLSEWGKIDGIVSMWMYPKQLVQLGGESAWDDDVLAKTVKGVKSFSEYPAIVNAGDQLDGYTPRNKKLYCYPYNFLYVSNNAGGAAAYRYEHFNDTGDIGFKIHGALAPEAGAKIVPLNYKGVSAAYDEGLTLPGFPTCAWDSDTYKVWLAQNQNMHSFQQGSGMLKVATGAIAGLVSGVMMNGAGVAGGIGMAASGALQIAEQLAQKKDMEIQPPQARGQHSANVNLSAGKHCFTVQAKTVTREYAMILDNYFTMYGYKIDRVQKPNIAARPAFTYVKTIGCHIKGNMCNEDTVKIESIFDHGITFWKNGDKVADYTQTNTV